MGKLFDFKLPSDAYISWNITRMNFLCRNGFHDFRLHVREKGPGFVGCKRCYLQPTPTVLEDGRTWYKEEYEKRPVIELKA